VKCGVKILFSLGMIGASNLAFGLPSHAADKMPVLILRAPRHGYRNALVILSIPKASLSLGPTDALLLEAQQSKERLPCQPEADGKTLRLTFLLPELPQGAERAYTLRRVQKTAPANAVTIARKGADVEITVGNTLFTRYTTQSGPNKPYFYPILTPDGSPLTRRWPLEQVPGESHDHPHHRGLWFTHGSVNGFDFWSEEKGAAKTINTGFSGLESGPVFGVFHASTEWRAPDGKLVATDTRAVRVYRLPDDSRMMDFEIVLKPVGSPLVFGDTKEGMFGLRVADTLAVRADRSAQIKGQGHIETSAGNKDSAAWGKSAEWVDYWGPINGQTYGVAIFDDPHNIRHPETWHARDYGLFAVNPFGLHDFGLGPKGAGDFTVAVNGTLVFHYRLLFHKGDTTSAAVADCYAAYADPPEAVIR
jgi:hypothetical protein